MQKRSFAIMFALVMTAAVYALPLYAQESQSVGVTVPFAFSANGKDLPAGSYRIEPVGDNRVVWGIRSLESDTKSFLLASNRSGSSNDKLTVTFHRYGEVSYLVGFKTPSYNVLLPASAAEKNLRRARGPLSQMDVVEVEINVASDPTGRQ